MNDNQVSCMYRNNYFLLSYAKVTQKINQLENMIEEMKASISLGKCFQTIPSG